MGDLVELGGVNLANLCDICFAPGELTACSHCGLAGHIPCLAGPAHFHEFH